MKIKLVPSDIRAVTAACLATSQKLVISTLTDCPDDQLVDNLICFTNWAWDKGDLHHWVSVMNRFDEHLESYVYKIAYNKDSISVPKVHRNCDAKLIVHLLRVTLLIVENCTSKSLFNSLERVTGCLDSFNPLIARKAMRIISLYYSSCRRSRRSISDNIGHPEMLIRFKFLCLSPLNDFIFLPKDSISHTTRSSENNTTMLSLVLGEGGPLLLHTPGGISPTSSNVMNVPLISPDPLSTHSAPSSSHHWAMDVPTLNKESNEILVKRITLSDLGAFKFWSTPGLIPQTEAEIEHYDETLMIKMQQKIEEHYGTLDPVYLRHMLRVVLVHSLPVYLPWRSLLLEYRLSSIGCLLADSLSGWNNFLSSHPLFLSELCELVKDHSRISTSLCITALNLFASLVQERVSAKSWSSLIGVQFPSGVIPTLLRTLLRTHDLNFIGYKEYSLPCPKELEEEEKAAYHVEFTDVDISGVKLDEADEWIKEFGAKEEKNNFTEDDGELLMTTLNLITSYVHNFGSSVNQSHFCKNLMAIILRCRNNNSLPVVAGACRLLELLSEISNNISHMVLKDLNGIELYINRFQYECAKIIQLMNSVQLSEYHTDRTKYWSVLREVFERRVIIRLLLHLMLLALQTTRSSIAVRAHSRLFRGPLLKCLGLIFNNLEYFGCAVADDCVVLLTEFAASDPTCVSEMAKEGGILKTIINTTSENTAVVLSDEGLVVHLADFFKCVCAVTFGQNLMKDVKFKAALVLFRSVFSCNSVAAFSHTDYPQTIGEKLRSVANTDTMGIFIEGVDKELKDFLEEIRSLPPWKPTNTRSPYYLEQNITIANRSGDYTNPACHVISNSPMESSPDWLTPEVGSLPLALRKSYGESDWETSLPKDTIGSISMIKGCEKFAPDALIADRIVNLCRFLCEFSYGTRAQTKFFNANTFKVLYEIVTTNVLPPCWINNCNGEVVLNALRTMCPIDKFCSSNAQEIILSNILQLRKAVKNPTNMNLIVDTLAKLDITCSFMIVTIRESYELWNGKNSTNLVKFAKIIPQLSSALSWLVRQIYSMEVLGRTHDTHSLMSLVQPINIAANANPSVAPNTANQTALFSVHDIPVTRQPNATSSFNYSQLYYTTDVARCSYKIASPAFLYPSPYVLNKKKHHVSNSIINTPLTKIVQWIDVDVNYPDTDLFMKGVKAMNVSMKNPIPDSFDIKQELTAADDIIKKIMDEDNGMSDIILDKDSILPQAFVLEICRNTSITIRGVLTTFSRCVHHPLQKKSSKASHHQGALPTHVLMASTIVNSILSLVSTLPLIPAIDGVTPLPEAMRHLELKPIATMDTENMLVPTQNGSTVITQSSSLESLPPIDRKVESEEFLHCISLLRHARMAGEYVDMIGKILFDSTQSFLTLTLDALYKQGAVHLLVHRILPLCYSALLAVACARGSLSFEDCFTGEGIAPEWRNMMPKLISTISSTFAYNDMNSLLYQISSGVGSCLALIDRLATWRNVFTPVCSQVLHKFNSADGIKTVLSADMKAKNKAVSLKDNIKNAYFSFDIVKLSSSLCDTISSGVYKWYSAIASGSEYEMLALSKNSSNITTPTFADSKILIARCLTVQLPPSTVNILKPLYHMLDNNAPQKANFITQWLNTNKPSYTAGGNAVEAGAAGVTMADFLGGEFTNPFSLGLGGRINSGRSSGNNEGNAGTSADSLRMFNRFTRAMQRIEVREPTEENIQTLVEMGFDRSSVIEALRECNNDVPAAAEILVTMPFFVSSRRPAAAAPTSEAITTTAAPAPPPSVPRIEPDPVTYQNLLDMGFPADRAAHALRIRNNNLEAAMEWLWSHEDEPIPADSLPVAAPVAPTADTPAETTQAAVSAVAPLAVPVAASPVHTPVNASDATPNGGLSSIVNTATQAILRAGNAASSATTNALNMNSIISTLRTMLDNGLATPTAADQSNANAPTLNAATIGIPSADISNVTPVNHPSTATGAAEASYDPMEDENNDYDMDEDEYEDEEVQVEDRRLFSRWQSLLQNQQPRNPSVASAASKKDSTADAEAKEKEEAELEKEKIAIGVCDVPGYTRVQYSTADEALLKDIRSNFIAGSICFIVSVPDSAADQSSVILRLLDCQASTISGDTNDDRELVAASSAPMGASGSTRNSKIKNAPGKTPKTEDPVTKAEALPPAAADGPYKPYLSEHLVANAAKYLLVVAESAKSKSGANLIASRICKASDCNAPFIAVSKRTTEQVAYNERLSCLYIILALICDKRPAAFVEKDSKLAAKHYQERNYQVSSVYNSRLFAATLPLLKSAVRASETLTKNQGVRVMNSLLPNPSIPLPLFALLPGIIDNSILTTNSLQNICSSILAKNSVTPYHESLYIPPCAMIPQWLTACVTFLSLFYDCLSLRPTIPAKDDTKKYEESKINRQLSQENKDENKVDDNKPVSLDLTNDAPASFSSLEHIEGTTIKSLDEKEGNLSHNKEKNVKGDKKESYTVTFAQQIALMKYTVDILACFPGIDVDSSVVCLSLLTNLLQAPYVAYSFMKYTPKAVMTQISYSETKKSKGSDSPSLSKGSEGAAQDAIRNKLGGSLGVILRLARTGNGKGLLHAVSKTFSVLARPESGAFVQWMTMTTLLDHMLVFTNLQALVAYPYVETPKSVLDDDILHSNASTSVTIRYPPLSRSAVVNASNNFNHNLNLLDNDPNARLSFPSAVPNHTFNPTNGTYHIYHDPYSNHPTTIISNNQTIHTHNGGVAHGPGMGFQGTDITPSVNRYSTRRSRRSINPSVPSSAVNNIQGGMNANAQVNVPGSNQGANNAVQSFHDLSNDEEFKKELLGLKRLDRVRLVKMSLNLPRWPFALSLDSLLFILASSCYNYPHFTNQLFTVHPLLHSKYAKSNHVGNKGSGIHAATGGAPTFQVGEWLELPSPPWPFVSSNPSASPPRPLLHFLTRRLLPAILSCNDTLRCDNAPIKLSNAYTASNINTSNPSTAANMVPLGISEAVNGNETRQTKSISRALKLIDILVEVPEINKGFDHQRKILSEATLALRTIISNLEQDNASKAASNYNVLGLYESYADLCHSNIKSSSVFVYSMLLWKLLSLKPTAASTSSKKKKSSPAPASNAPAAVNNFPSTSSVNLTQSPTESSPAIRTAVSDVDGDIGAILNSEFSAIAQENTTGVKDEGCLLTAADRNNIRNSVIRLLVTLDLHRDDATYVGAILLKVLECLTRPLIHLKSAKNKKSNVLLCDKISHALNNLHEDGVEIEIPLDDMNDNDMLIEYDDEDSLEVYPYDELDVDFEDETDQDEFDDDEDDREGDVIDMNNDIDLEQLLMLNEGDYEFDDDEYDYDEDEFDEDDEMMLENLDLENGEGVNNSSGVDGENVNNHMMVDSNQGPRSEEEEDEDDDVDGTSLFQPRMDRSIYTINPEEDDEEEFLDSELDQDENDDDDNAAPVLPHEAEIDSCYDDENEDEENDEGGRLDEEDANNDLMMYGDDPHPGIQEDIDDANSIFYRNGIYDEDEGDDMEDFDEHDDDHEMENVHVDDVFSDGNPQEDGQARGSNMMVMDEGEEGYFHTDDSLLPTSFNLAEENDGDQERNGNPLFNNIGVELYSIYPDGSFRASSGSRPPRDQQLARDSFNFIRQIFHGENGINDLNAFVSRFYNNQNQGSWNPSHNLGLSGSNLPAEFANLPEGLSPNSATGGNNNNIVTTTTNIGGVRVTVINATGNPALSSGSAAANSFEALLEEAYNNGNGGGNGITIGRDNTLSFHSNDRDGGDITGAGLNSDPARALLNLATGRRNLSNQANGGSTIPVNIWKESRVSKSSSWYTNQVISASLGELYMKYNHPLMIDSNGCAAVIRMLYLRKSIHKGLLHRVFLNLCSSHLKTREAVIRLLVLSLYNISKNSSILDGQRHLGIGTFYEQRNAVLSTGSSLFLPFSLFGTEKALSTPTFDNTQSCSILKVAESSLEQIRSLIDTQPLCIDVFSAPQPCINSLLQDYHQNVFLSNQVTEAHKSQKDATNREAKRSRRKDDTPTETLATAAPTKTEFLINVLLDLVSNPAILSSALLMEHLLSILFDLICGSQSANWKTTIKKINETLKEAMHTKKGATAAEKRAAHISASDVKTTLATSHQKILKSINSDSAVGLCSIICKAESSNSVVVTQNTLQKVTSIIGKLLRTEHLYEPLNNLLMNEIQLLSDNIICDVRCLREKLFSYFAQSSLALGGDDIESISTIHDVISQESNLLSSVNSNANVYDIAKMKEILLLSSEELKEMKAESRWWALDRVIRASPEMFKTTGEKKDSSLTRVVSFLERKEFLLIWKELDLCLSVLSKFDIPGLSSKTQHKDQLDHDTDGDVDQPVDTSPTNAAPNTLTPVSRLWALHNPEAQGSGGASTTNRQRTAPTPTTPNTAGGTFEGLSNTISTQSHHGSITIILSQLLPILSSFFHTLQIMIAEERKLPSPLPSTDINAEDPLMWTGDSSQVSPRQKSLFLFCERHRKVLNTLIKSYPLLLTSELLPWLRLSPNTIDFANKRTVFRSQLKVLKGESRQDQLRLQVRREHVFTDSFHQVMRKSNAEMKGKLNVVFNMEEGVDAGGVTREWLSILAKEMFKPDYVLFKQCGSKSEFNYPNTLSYVNPEHLSYFEFIGRIIAKSLYESLYLDAYFARSFYKYLLGRKSSTEDMEALDPEFYKNLTTILNYSLDDLGLDLTFTTEIDEFGKQTTVDLKPGGSEIAVTEENKKEYVELLCEHKMILSVKKQLDSIVRGFDSIIPRRLLAAFDDKEFELLLSGLPSIDLDDLQNHTEYKNFTPNSPQIEWLWKLLREFDQNMLAMFLQFTTGTSKVPLGGFKELVGVRGLQKFQIHKAFGDKHRLPAAHTCMNQLDLPEYDQEEVLRRKVVQAILLANTGFAFA